MLDYIRGTVAELTPAVAVLDCNGLGYEINITLMDYPKIPATGEARLYVHEAIREDAHLLYGFLDKESRGFFRLLIGVNGVGPNIARLILSSLPVTQVQSAIANGEDKLFKSVKGVGARIAQRIILDLKDKVKAPLVSAQGVGGVAAGEAFEDAQGALVMLGFSAPQCQKALSRIFADDPSVTTEKAVKLALTML